MPKINYKKYVYLLSIIMTEHNMSVSPIEYQYEKSAQRS